MGPNDDSTAQDEATVGEPTASAGTLEVRPLSSHEELLAVEQLQRDVWGLDEVEIVPGSQIRAVIHAGGQLAGAFVDGRLVGFSYGFLAQPHGRGMRGPGLHSHMVAVNAAARGHGVGRALKWDQRAWCLARGLGWITWTFDPLQARNANLNLEHLGAVGAEYLPDFYGPMSGPLGGGQATDRLLALWPLASDVVEGLRAGGVRPAAPRPPAAVWALRRAGEGALAGPQLVPVDDEAVSRGAAILVAVPTDVTHLLGAAPDLARAWRAAVGRAMIPLFDRGYAASRMVEGAYVLQPFGEDVKAAVGEW
ncbi:MAG: GNAT family N-acetyltransferase [Trueperaceae bacterium]|nr:GNAT family N-acetyltransferase [Trueperaceae bacterium]